MYSCDVHKAASESRQADVDKGVSMTNTKFGNLCVWYLTPF